MKTHVKFEPSDFRNGGQMIIHQSSPIGCGDIGFMASVSYKVGYRYVNSGPHTAIKISLSDGMCIEYETIEEFCDKINSDPQGYRPMSSEEISKVMAFVGNGFSPY